ncbi:hypothetical protein [uncultured Parvimonas sp.]|uniref:hypothetical protein n=1 Tax=uncultured Parvimonas sp. TaxID=747372 RepID=UPI00280439A3|nr:hypothetical protein [uncultured Parvimonas sp.]
MLEVLKKYSGIILFYLVIVGMVFLINSRFSELNEGDEVITVAPEFCNAHYCELYFSPLYKRVLLCQEIFIFVLYNLVQ